MEKVIRLYELRHDESDAAPQRRTIGRLWIQGDKVRHLEDYHGRLEELFPEDIPFSAVERRLTMLQRNPYYEVIDEKDLAEGHHPHELKQLDLGEMEADQKFQMVEIWHDAVMIDGRRLEEDEARQVLHEVSSGRLVLTPVG
jgi:hypothetical protein